MVEKLSEPKRFRKIMKGLILVIGAIFFFKMGVIAGFHKAKFEGDWSSNYNRNFGMTRRGPMMKFSSYMGGDRMPNAHGAAGKIIKVELPTLIVVDSDGTEKVVVINDQTVLRAPEKVATKDDLTLDATVVVIGSPNTQGQIEAKFIRIMPSGFTQ